RHLRMVAPERIGRDQGLDAEVAKSPHFLEDPDVASAVPEERRRGDHQHAHRRLIVAEGRRAPGGPARQPRRYPFARKYASSASGHGRSWTPSVAARRFARTPFGDGRRAGAPNSLLVTGSSLGVSLHVAKIWRANSYQEHRALFARW